MRGWPYHQITFCLEVISSDQAAKPLIQSHDKEGIFLNTRINPKRSHDPLDFPALARRQESLFAWLIPDWMLPWNPYWAWLMHPAVNTDTYSVPRPGTIPQALIHPCLLIPLPANPPACWSDKELSQVTLSQWSGGGGSATVWAHLMVVSSAVCSPHQGRQLKLSSRAWSDRKAFLAYFWSQSWKEPRGRKMEKGTEKEQETKVDRRIKLLSLKN